MAKRGGLKETGDIFDLIQQTKRPAGRPTSETSPKETLIETPQSASTPRTFDTLMNETRPGETPEVAVVLQGPERNSYLGVKVVGKDNALVPWSKILEGQHLLPATDDDRRRVAKSLGMRDARGVPNGMKFGELLAWVTNKLAISGVENAANAVLDRISPKPKRLDVAVTAHTRVPVAAEDEPGAAEAAAYMEALESE
jgi:hypothetical protein